MDILSEPFIELFGIPISYGNLLSVHITSASFIALVAVIRANILAGILGLLANLLNPFAVIYAAWLGFVILKRSSFRLFRLTANHLGTKRESQKGTSLND